MRYIAVCGLGLSLILAGCGSGGRLAVVPVSGLVTLNGDPLPDASVTFIPEKGKPATGKTDQTGIYRLTTYTQGDGAVIGKHKIAISKMTDLPESNTPEELAKIKHVLPETYADPERSGLTAEVKSGQTADIDFNLIN